jgi:hypothetical protein
MFSGKDIVKSEHVAFYGSRIGARYCYLESVPAFVEPANR